MCVCVCCDCCELWGEEGGRWACVCACVQNMATALLFGAGTGGVMFMSLLLEEFGVDVDVMGVPGCVP